MIFMTAPLGTSGDGPMDTSNRSALSYPCGTRNFVPAYTISMPILDVVAFENGNPCQSGRQAPVLSSVLQEIICSRSLPLACHTTTIH
jgi:hypothetical protein